VTGREQLIHLLQTRSVRHGDFLLASGRRSPYYIDARLATMSAEGQDVIGRSALAAIRASGWCPTAVGGLTLGADPVACAIARASLDTPPVIDAFTVRKAVKDHGTGRRIEGNLDPGSSVVVVEDVITSGASALQAVQAIQQEGGKVLGVVAVVDREEGGRENIEAFGLKVVVLATATQLGLAKVRNA
jgi:orotate phosphoribosyltransferase